MRLGAVPARRYAGPTRARGFPVAAGIQPSSSKFVEVIRTLARSLMAYRSGMALTSDYRGHVQAYYPASGKGIGAFAVRPVIPGSTEGRIMSAEYSTGIHCGQQPPGVEFHPQSRSTFRETRETPRIQMCSDPGDRSLEQLPSRRRIVRLVPQTRMGMW